MRLQLRDLIGTVLVAAIAIPYVGYLIDGEMPLVQDARGMSAVGLILGIAAFFTMRAGDEWDRLGRTEAAMAIVTLVLGVVAVAFSETGAAELLLAVFMLAIGVVWVVELLDHAGLLPGGHHPAGSVHA